MEKIILMSTDLINDLQECELPKFFNIIKDLITRNNVICILSRNKDKLDYIKKKFEYERIFDRVHYKTRRDINDIINKNVDKSHYFVVFGNRDKDFELAVNNKFLYMVPLWTKDSFKKCIKYGIHIENLDIFYKVIQTINNHNKWYYKLKLKDGTDVYSLISAHTYNLDISKKEKELVEGFEDFLKRGKISYYKILLYHFLAAIANNPDFREVNTWAIMPSSGTILNENMLEFKERARYCMKGMLPKEISSGIKPNNVFLRHKAIDKSHSMPHEQRITYGCRRHLDSIVINDAYRNQRLKGKTVCVFDDYLTNGNSFESIRNLLKTEKVKKIIFVSLGRFRRPYYYQEYSINGNVFYNGYTYRKLHSEMLYDGIYDNNARREVENLYDIFNL